MDKQRREAGQPSVFLWLQDEWTATVENFFGFDPSSLPLLRPVRGLNDFDGPVVVIVDQTSRQSLFHLIRRPARHPIVILVPEDLPAVRREETSAARDAARLLCNVDAFRLRE